MDNLKSHFDLNFYKIQGKKSINTFNNFIIQTNRETDHRIRISLCAFKLLFVSSTTIPFIVVPNSATIFRRVVVWWTREEIHNRVRATYRDLLTVSGAGAWAGRRIRGWNFARRRWDRACGGDRANCWKRSCRIRLPLLVDLLRGVPESSTLRTKTAIRENSTSL